MHGAGLQPAKAEVLLGKNGMSAKDENSYRYMAFYWLQKNLSGVTGLSWTLAYCTLPGAVDFQLCCQGSQRLPWSASGAGGQQERGALNLPFSFNQICFPWIQGFEWRHCLKTTFLYWRVWNERPTEWNSVPQWVWGNLTSWSGSHWPYGMSWASSDPRNCNFPEDLLALMSLCAEWIPCIVQVVFPFWTPFSSITFP